MPILNTMINDSIVGSEFDNNDSARINATNTIINSIRSKIISILSNDFELINPNDATYDGNNTVYIRDTFKVSDIENKYLVVELIFTYLFGRSVEYNNFEIKFIITNTIVNSTDSSINYIYEWGKKINSIVNISQRTDSQNISRFKYAISYTFNLLNFKNDNLSLYVIGDSSNYKNFDMCCGKCKIGNTDFIIWSNEYSRKDNRIFILFDKEGNTYYTLSKIIVNNKGTNNDNIILTLPIYLSNEESSNGIIYSDLLLETCLQVPSVSCSCGSTYKINDVEYFALGDNFLAKM